MVWSIVLNRLLNCSTSSISSPLLHNNRRLQWNRRAYSIYTRFDDRQRRARALAGTLVRHRLITVIDEHLLLRSECCISIIMYLRAPFIVTNCRISILFYSIMIVLKIYWYSCSGNCECSENNRPFSALWKKPKKSSFPRGPLIIPIVRARKKVRLSYR